MPDYTNLPPSPSSSNDIQPNPKPAGPYEFAMTLASSFGRLFPALVLLLLLLLIVLGVGYGIWASVDKVTAIQTALNKTILDTANAKVTAAESTANAKAMVESAKAAGLVETQEHLRAQNSNALDFSEKLQKLISGQLDNMRKNSDISREQEDRAKKFREQQEVSYKERLRILEGQIKDTEQKRSDLKFSQYLDYKTRITDQLKQGYSVDPTVLQLLEEKLENTDINSKAANDAQSKSELWSTRIALLLILYRHSGTTTFLDQAIDLTVKNPRALNYAIASLYAPRYGKSNGNSEELIVNSSNLVVNQQLNTEFRDGLLSSGLFYPPYGKTLHHILGEERIKDIAKYINSRLKSASPLSEAMCHPIPTYLGTLRNLSTEAEIVYATRILESPNASITLRACLKNSIANGQSYDRPSDLTFSSWPD